MARRRRSNRRHRGSGFRFLYRLLSMLVICGCLVTAVTLFFRVDTIQITGLKRYTEEDILGAAEIAEGDNLFLLNKFEAAKKISEQLPYIEIENVWIRRKLPDMLLIDVKECGRPLAVEQDGTVWLMSYGGKIVEQVGKANGYAVLDGLELLAPSVGTQAEFGTEHEEQQTSLFALLDALEAAGKQELVQGIHLEASYLTMDYMDRFTVKMSYGADYAYKIKTLDAIMESGKIQENMAGTFDMRGEDGKTNFIQNIW